MIKLKELPYSKTALEPYITENTLNYHYDKHHKTYVDNLNKLIEGTDLENETLEKIIIASQKDLSKKGVFNNAAQVWNHDFFWASLRSANTEEIIPERLLKKINDKFESVAEFKKQFSDACVKNFGSGWTWLILNKERNELEIASTSNAENFLSNFNVRPLLVIDVWEHAYYLDYQNKRAEYVSKIIDNILNFEFADENLL